MKFATVTRIEGVCYSKCGSRLSAAHNRFKRLQQLHGSRGMLLEILLSPQRRAHSSYKFATVTRIEGVCYSKCGSRRSAAHIRFKNVQPFHGSRAYVTQSVALALAPRTFVFKICNSFRDRGHVLLKMWLSPQRRAHSSYTFATVTRIEGICYSK